MKGLSYPLRAIQRKEPEGGHTAIVASLPGCITYGDTLECVEMAKAAIELYIETSRHMAWIDKDALD
jgi:antitoxin HicB